MDKRTPLRREAVTPVDMYTKPQVDKPESPQVAKTTQQVVKPTNLQTDKTTSGEVYNPLETRNHKEN